MIRNLLITAAAGVVIFFISAGAFIAMGGVEAARRGDFEFDIDGHHVYRDHGRHGDMDSDSRYGPRAERTLDWAGGDSLALDIPAEVVFTQAAAPSITVSGPKRMVDRVSIEDGHIRFADDDDMMHMGRWSHHGRRLRIQVAAPAVKAFTINGPADLTIRDYDQPSLDVRINGSGDVEGFGKTTDLTLSIAGSGDADLSRLTADSARVKIAGSGDAMLDAVSAADVRIAGSGDVTLERRPPTLTSDIAGSGDLDVPN
ncbi:MAG: DUF2807 domain-containing protein [Caulobacter sp.]|nr:DUF2807 domain-containing protein [Caulobacter sp.]